MRKYTLSESVYQLSLFDLPSGSGNLQPASKKGADTTAKVTSMSNDSSQMIDAVVHKCYTDLVFSYIQMRSKTMSKANQLKVISLFTGAGGLDIGFEKAGFSIAVAVEIDPACCDTLKTTRPINKSITELSSNEILEVAGLAPLEAALVIGGPPCQSFSLAGLRKGLDDDRGKLLLEFVRVVRETLPFGFVLENVKGLTNWDSGNALKLLVEELSKPIKYNGKTYSYTIAPPRVLNAVDYGVPQFRERLILVGNRVGLPFTYPDPYDISERRTVKDAIGDLPEPEQPSEMAQIVAKSIKGRREKHGY